MPITSWIRDLFGIQKDMYETKKTRLEIEKIEDEKKERRIILATQKDVERYDPKAQQLYMMEAARRAQEESRIRAEMQRKSEHEGRMKDIGKRKEGCVVLLVLALFLTALLFVVTW